jgi:WD40 repeat protein
MIGWVEGRKDVLMKSRARRPQPNLKLQLNEVIDMIQKRFYLFFSVGLGVFLFTAGCIGKAGTPPSIRTMPASPTLLPTTGADANQAGNKVQPQETTTNPNTPTFEEPIVLSGHSSAVTRLSWSSDGSLLASGCGDFQSQDNTIRIWRSDGTLQAMLTGHTMPVTGLSWSPDGKILASSSLDETIRLWRSDGTLLRVLEGHAGHVFAVAWSPDGKFLASGSIVTYLNPTVQLWDLGGKIIKTMSTSFSGGKFYNLSWSPDGQFLAGGATDYKLWKSDGTEVFWFESSEQSNPAWGLAWSPNSQLWAIGDESGNLRIYNTQGTRIALVQDQGGVSNLAWSPDSRQIASATTLWLADGSARKTLIGQSANVKSVAWSPDGKILASGGSDALIHLWTSDGQPAGVLSGHTANIRMVAWSPDGKIIASASEDKTIRLWRLK